MDDFNNGLDSKLASRMRKVHSEQFHTLVKMHLSFELDLNTEDNDTVTEKAKLKRWGLLHFTKKPKSNLNVQKGVESAALTKEGINQVKQLVEYLSKEECIQQEGIFRRTGKLTRQQELKTALYQGLPLNLDEGKYSVHDCASVLKGYLADLTEPLLTDLHYPEYCRIAELCTANNSSNDCRLTRVLQLLLLLLTPQNRYVLKNILSLLHKTAEHESSNKMNCDTLATLFTPHLMCPRKLSPEALHANAQHLSGLVAFMIKKGIELFEIPPKLSTDIRAFWVEQEKKLLSPLKTDMNESSADTTGTAQTVFSFVDRNLTAQATATQDTQAALAQLYAHIQSMPESSKKRRLVKQFNKENGQGTPRHVKHNATVVTSGGTSNSSGRSFGDSIKKRIFQRKLLNHKKIVDVKIGCNFSRSSSEENIVSNSLESPALLPKMLSKSEDELSDLENYDVLGHQQQQQQSDNNNLLKVKHISNSTGSLDTPVLTGYKSKVILKSFLNISETSTPSRAEEAVQPKSPSISTCSSGDDACTERPSSDDSDQLAERQQAISSSRAGDTLQKVLPQPANSSSALNPIASDEQSNSETGVLLLSPSTKNRLRCLYAAHTSTPSNLLGRSSNLLAHDYALTPIGTDDERSMSPITQSATKMTKAMQETMMTPRSRKPVIMISASNSNLCNLTTLNSGSIQYDSTNSLHVSNLTSEKKCGPHFGESPASTDTTVKKDARELESNKENVIVTHRTPEEQQTFVTCLEYDPNCTAQRTSISTNANTFKEYYLSRSVLTASPVDLSFTSRTGDFDQSNSDLNVVVEEINEPGSDTSGIASGSTNSINNSAEKITQQEKQPSPRKRCTSLDRDDWKRSMEDDSYANATLWQENSVDKCTLKSIKDSLSETSF